MKDLKFSILLILIIFIGLVNIIWLASLQVKVNNLPHKQLQTIPQLSKEIEFEKINTHQLNIVDSNNKEMISLYIEEGSAYIDFNSLGSIDFYDEQGYIVLNIGTDYDSPQSSIKIGRGIASQIPGLADWGNNGVIELSTSKKGADISLEDSNSAHIWLKSFMNKPEIGLFAKDEYFRLSGIEMIIDKNIPVIFLYDPNDNNYNHLVKKNVKTIILTEAIKSPSLDRLHEFIGKTIEILEQALSPTPIKEKTKAKIKYGTIGGEKKDN